MRIGLACLALLPVLSVAQASGAEVAIISTPAPVTRIVETVAGVFIRTDKGARKLHACDKAVVCLREAAIEGDLKSAPSNALPDGKVAIAADGDIRRAWYGRPTDRYGHGVLGDAIEAGSLVAVDDSGRHFEYVLDQSHVFEDITPRLHDLDRDGTNEIITIRSSLERGAAIAIFGIVDGVLAELAATPDVGRSNRWLNIAGIADFPGAHVEAIAWIETPHIGGVLRMGIFDGEDFDIFSNSYNGFSNHFIGSRELGLSAVGDFSGDGAPDLAIPSADRNSLVIATRTGLKSVPLPGRVTHAVATVDGLIVTADANGRLIAIRP